MTAKRARKPKLDTERNGQRVRVYVTGQEYEVLVGEGDIEDPEADVWCFPKIGTPEAWVDQALINQRASDQRGS